MKPSGICRNRTVVFLAVVWGAVALPAGAATVTKERVAWPEPGGGPVDQFTLTNTQGLEVKVINRGATITSVRVPDREGNLENVAFRGAVMGRYANRIAGARFTLDGVEHRISANAGENHIHGGKEGFHTVAWDARPFQSADSAGVKLTHTSPDGHEGYPGTVAVQVVYRLTDSDWLRMEYTAQTDKPTHLNLTNHAYWNLAGADSGDVLDQVLYLNADRYLPFGDKKIPLGEILSAKETCMDFTQPETIGARIDEVEGGDYDHCYVLNKGPDKGMPRCARAVDPKSGRVMDVYTTQPGVQLYTGNRQGFCLETQHYPNSPNEPDFPSTILRPGQTYHEVTVHIFSVE